MSEKQRILLVDDDPNISHLVRLYLEKEGFDVTEAARGDEALEAFRRETPALVLLDVMLPGMDGLQVLKEIRKTSKVPVIMLTARDETFDKVLGLELGADDYVTKPFGTAELLARIRTALRRAEGAGGRGAASGKLENGGLCINYDTRRVLVDGNEVHLTHIEYKIVTLIAQYLGKVLTYDYIIRNVWGSRPTVDNQILRVNMANIRRKLEKNPAEPRYIITETGIGYRMVDYTED